MSGLHVALGDQSYDILVQRGALDTLASHMNLDRRILILTDDGVPQTYAQRVAAQCGEPYIYTVPQGEESKSFAQFEQVLSFMLEKGFTRYDGAVAVGGGVCGDLCGFCASAYMRGIDFYNVPTTVLSQVDSSIGGKTAINLNGVKNVIGAFWQPRAVVVDPNTLHTLSARHCANGLAEAVKMAVTFDEELFSLFESEAVECHIPESVIVRSLECKRRVVEQDAREANLRKMLNFGHTIGHGIESCTGLGGLLHGECVAAGMLPMCGPDIRARVRNVLKRLNLPTKVRVDSEEVLAAIRHDKKVCRDGVTVIMADCIGQGYMKELSFAELEERVREVCAP